jgi:hypothetical protein
MTESDEAPMQLEIPPILARTVLELVRDGGGMAGWHWLAARLPRQGVPLRPDLMKVLHAFRARGLVASREVSPGKEVWVITTAGQAHLAELSRPGPLTEEGLAQVLADLRSGGAAGIAALIPFAGDSLQLWGVLRQVLAADIGLAEAVAFGGSLLPASDRGAFARELLDDPREPVRVAFFRAWLPARVDIPGQAVRIWPDDVADDLLRRGLTDVSMSVRAAAAALAFASDRGASLVGELVTQLGAPERELRFWSILALGSAVDELSRAMLERIVDDPEPRFAAAAVRALAARRDGRVRWLAALGDERSEVQSAAVFALAEVALDLSPDEIAQLARDPRPDVQAALARFHARTR